MRIPFLSKKTKKILEKNEERLLDLTEEQMDQFIKRTTLDPKAKGYIAEDTLVKQLVKENTELKVVHDDLQEQLSKRLKQGEDSIIEIGNGTWTFHNNIKVLLNSRIKIGKKREVDIKYGSFVGKIPGFFKTRQFRTWFVEPEGEYTYDPRDKTPIEIKTKNEMQIELGHLAAQKNLGAALSEDLGSRIKKWWEQLGIPIIISVIIFIFLLFMGLFFGQYNMTKA